MDDDRDEKKTVLYTTDNKHDAGIKKEIFESHGIRCQIDIQTDDKTASAWGMPMGMEHLVRTYLLSVDTDDLEQGKQLLTSKTVDEILFMILLDREHNVLLSPQGFPRGSIDAAANPKRFSFIGEHTTSEGVYQFFTADRGKKKITLNEEGFYWRPLQTVVSELRIGKSFRESYIEVMLGGFTPPAEIFSAWGFGSTPSHADKLGALVQQGTKRATAGLTASYEAENEPIPEKGDISVIVDGDGRPMAVIRTTDVQTLPFREVTAEMAAEEGEGDKSLDYWRREHRKFFKKECKAIGISFSEDASVVFERFELLKNL